jgi:hypothetical protein
MIISFKRTGEVTLKMPAQLEQLSALSVKGIYQYYYSCKLYFNVDLFTCIRCYHSKVCLPIITGDGAVLFSKRKSVNY